MLKVSEVCLRYHGHAWNSTVTRQILYSLDVANGGVEAETTKSPIYLGEIMISSELLTHNVQRQTCSSSLRYVVPAEVADAF